MEKRTLKSFFLRRIARRLQNWSNFLLKQAEEIEHPAPGLSSVSSASVTRVALKPTSTQETNALTDSPPVHWLARVASTSSEPPADWLARVQQNAPDFLEQTQASGHNILVPTRAFPMNDFPHREVGMEATQKKHSRSRQRPLVPNETTSQPPQTPLEADSPYALSPDSLTVDAQRHRPNLPSFTTISRVPTMSRRSIPPQEQPTRHPSDHQRRFPGSSEPGKANVGTAQEVIFHAGEQLLASTVPDRDTWITHNHWPSLPVSARAPAHPTQDWEMARRHWQRWQRLEEEQRGRSWNV